MTDTLLITIELGIVIISRIILQSLISVSRKKYIYTVLNNYLYDSVRKITFFTRNYVTTGVKVNLNAIIEFFDVRSGKLPWSVLDTDDIGIFLGERKDKITNLYDNYEVVASEEVKQLLDNIRWYSTTAINWYDGRRDTDDKQAYQQFISDINEPFISFPLEIPEEELEEYQNRAFDLMFSKEYIDMWQSIQKNVMEGAIYSTNSNDKNYQRESFITVICIQIIAGIVIAIIK